MTPSLRVTAGAYSRALTRVPEETWPDTPPGFKSRPTEMWRSRDFLLQVYEERGYTRLSVIRTDLDHSGRWRDGISWDELQRLKAECGRGDAWAVEVYPPAEEAVTDCNMRHLFILPEPPPYGWKKEGRDG